MHHLAFEINFQIHYVSPASPVSIHLLIHSIFVNCHHRYSQSITPSLHAQNQPFQQILPTLIYFFTHWTVFVIMGLDRTYHAHQFIFSFFSFTFFVHSVWYRLFTAVHVSCRMVTVKFTNLLHLRFLSVGDTQTQTAAMKALSPCYRCLLYCLLAAALALACHYFHCE